MTLSKTDREEIIDYLGEFNLYEEVCVNNRDFVLVHAGLENFQPTRPLSSYELYEMIFGRTDYAKVYFKDKYLVTGHTPTQLIKENIRYVLQSEHKKKVIIRTPLIPQDLSIKKRITLRLIVAVLLGVN